MTDTYALAPNDRVAFFDKKVRKHVTRTVLAVGLGTRQDDLLHRWRHAHTDRTDSDSSHPHRCGHFGDHRFNQPG